jgi:hypothetical protein
MMAASIKYRTLKFNAKAAGVGSLLFYIALVGIYEILMLRNNQMRVRLYYILSLVLILLGAFTPTLYYIAFNGYREECTGCYSEMAHNVTKFVCESCHYVAVAKDPEHV